MLVVAGNQVGDRAIDDGVPATVSDPSHSPAPDAVVTAVPLPEVSTAPVEEKVWQDPRNEIAARFKNRRENHDSQFTPDHVPPFVANPPATEAPVVEATLAPTPIAPAAAPYTLKVRGQEIPVSSRADLLRLAEVEPHEEADFDDARLVRIAQKNQAALAVLDEAKAARDQARVTAPAPAGNPPADQQHTPAPTSQTPTLAELTAAYTERQAYGDPAEAAEAYRALRDAENSHYENLRNSQVRQMTRAEEANQAVVDYSVANQDVIAHPMASDALLMAATREMESDLRQAGLTDDQLRGVIGNPALMSQAFNAARDHGLRTRDARGIIEAAGQKVRQAFNLSPAPAASPTPQSNAASRIDEKRGLTAQPTRSGNPASTPTPQPNQQASRKAAIAQMQRSRTEPNVRQVLG